MDIDKGTEEKIFHAATEVFLAKGYSGARMQQIADSAGINKALLHYYFRSKEKLFSAVFDHLLTSLIKQFAGLFSGGLSIEEKVNLFFDKHIGFIQSNDRLPLFILNEIQKNPDILASFITRSDFRKLLNDVTSWQTEEWDSVMSPAETLQLLISMVSISVFPFAAREIIMRISPEEPFDFDGFIEERKRWAAEFVICGIRGLREKELQRRKEI